MRFFTDVLPRELPLLKTKPLSQRNGLLLPLICLVGVIQTSHARGETTEACPKEQLVVVDIDTWVKEARQAKTPAQLENSLARIGLQAADFSDDQECEDPTVKIRVDAFRAQLTDTGEPSRVVQVLGLICPQSNDKWQVQRGAIFVPQGKAYCRVDTPFLNRSGSAWGPELCDPVVFAFENLTAKTHGSIKVTDGNWWCGSSGGDRGGKTETSWWELHGIELDSLLSVTTERSYFHSPNPPTESLSTSIKMLDKAYPKKIELTENVTCDNTDTEMDNKRAKADLHKCKASKIRRLCTYDGRQYACGRVK